MSLAAMEAELKPKVLETFDISRALQEAAQLQDELVDRNCMRRLARRRKALQEAESEIITE